MGNQCSAGEPEPVLLQGPISPDEWASGEWLAATAEGDVVIWNAVADRLGKTHLAAGAERGRKCKQGKPSPPKIVEVAPRSGGSERCGRSMMLKCRHPEYQTLQCVAVAFSDDGSSLAAAYEPASVNSRAVVLSETWFKVAAVLRHTPAPLLSCRCDSALPPLPSPLCTDV